jgi:hypothetical protein
MSRDLRALTGLAGSCPSPAVFLHCWPHETLGHKFGRCFDSWMTKAVQGVEHLASKWCRNVWTRFAGRCDTVQRDGGAGNVRFSSRRAVSLSRRVCSSSSLSCDAASTSGVTGVVMVSTRDRASSTTSFRIYVLCPL